MVSRELLHGCFSSLCSLRVVRSHLRPQWGQLWWYLGSLSTAWLISSLLGHMNSPCRLEAKRAAKEQEIYGGMDFKPRLSPKSLRMAKVRLCKERLEQVM